MINHATLPVSAPSEEVILKETPGVLVVTAGNPVTLVWLVKNIEMMLSLY